MDEKRQLSTYLNTQPFCTCNKPSQVSTLNNYSSTSTPNSVYKLTKYQAFYKKTINIRYPVCNHKTICGFFFIIIKPSKIILYYYYKVWVWILFIEALASIYSSKRLRHEPVPFVENNLKKTVTLTCSLFIHFVILNMISRIRC